MGPDRKPWVSRGLPDQPPARVEERSQSAAVVRLQRMAGNRAVARLAARAAIGQGLSAVEPGAGVTQPTLARSPVAVSAPPTWTSQTTVENRTLAGDVDQFDQLSDADLARLRDAMALKASVWNDHSHAEYERKLEALEFLAGRRGVASLDWPAHWDARYDNPAQRRRNVRVALEKGVRQTGSLKKSIAGMASHAGVENDIASFQREADEFGNEFTSQAKQVALKMLQRSRVEVIDVLESYGFRREAADLAGRQLEHSDVGKVVGEWVNNERAWFDRPQGGVDPRRERAAIRETVVKLRAQQQVVQEIISDPGGAGQGAGAEPEQPHRLAEARQELSKMWTEAEVAHPVLAGFRGESRTSRMSISEASTPI